MRHPEEINGRREAEGLFADGSPVMVAIPAPIKDALREWRHLKERSDKMHFELMARQRSTNRVIRDHNSRQREAYAASDETREAMHKVYELMSEYEEYL